MTYRWYFIFNKTEFEATGLVSRTYSLILDDGAEQDFLVTKSNGLGITHDGIFLLLELNTKNPFAFDGRAIYIDANENVWWGFEVPDEN